VVDVGNDGHVTDVGWVVHEPTDLLDGEAKGMLLALVVLELFCILRQSRVVQMLQSSHCVRRAPKYPVQMRIFDLLDHLGGIGSIMWVEKVFW